MRLTLTLGALAMGSLALGQADQSALITYLRLKQEADRSEAHALAMVYGLPIRQLLPDGRIVELLKFRNGRPMYLTTDNVNAAISTRANRVHPGGGAGLSLTGTGVIIGEWDGGAARSDHQELTGRVTIGDGAGHAGHSTHVAGTMIASGVHPPAKGMAWGSTLRSFDWTTDVTEMGTEGAAGLRLSNHSYGWITGWNQSGGTWYWYGDRPAGHGEDAGFGFYDDTARDWDDVAYDNPGYLIFKSAGNDRGEGPASQPVSHREWDGSSWITVTDTRPLDGGATGYDTVSYHSGSKNVMTVGAVADVASYTGPGSVSHASFSGCGPVDDGRIKPDIVANGVALTSSYNNSTSGYASSTGTSMATPNACGSAALIIQHFKANASGVAPRADLLKGLIIHTADECGSNNGPDYMFGWGLMNTEAACAVITDNANNSSPRKLAPMRYGQIAHGQTREWPIQRSVAGQLKVTICWTDLPGTPPAWSVDPTTPMLKNDLDLRIIAPNGTTVNFPWRLDRLNPANAATKADNSVDNVEQVVIDAPVTGTYKIRVSHKGTLAGTVNFAMITSNAQPVTATLSSMSVLTSPQFSGVGNTGFVYFTMGCFLQTFVTLSDNSTYLSVPATVSVPEGLSSATFAITTSVVPTDRTVTITGVCAGVTRTTSVTLWTPYALYRVWMNKSRVIGGSTPLGGTVQMNHPNPMEHTVTFSDNSANLTPPASVLMPEGSTTANFSISTTEPAADHTATLTGTYNGISKTGTVTIIVPPILNAVNIAPASVTGGSSSTGTLYFNKAAPTGGVLISLVDNKPEMVTPATGLIPSHQWYGTFTITTVAVGSPVTGTVTATYRGVVKTDTLVINP